MLLNYDSTMSWINQKRYMNWFSEGSMKKSGQTVVISITLWYARMFVYIRCWTLDVFTPDFSSLAMMATFVTYFQQVSIKSHHRNGMRYRESHTYISSMIVLCKISDFSIYSQVKLTKNMNSSRGAKLLDRCIWTSAWISSLNLKDDLIVPSALLQ